MQSVQQHFEPQQSMPKTIRYCKACQKETPHEIVFGGGCVAKICIPCLEQASRAS
jgi:hypothetical protein